MHPMSAELFRRLNRFLSTAPVFTHEREIRELCTSTDLPLRDAAALLLFFRLGYDMDTDRDVYETYFHDIPELLSPSTVLQDPYMQFYPDTLQAQRGPFSLTWENSPAYELLPCAEHRIIHGKECPRIGFFTQTMRWPALCENGHTWMTLNPHEQNTLHPMADQLSGNTLIYGLGLGYAVYLALQNPNVKEVTVIEHSADVIRLFSDHLLSRIPRKTPLHIIEADAFEFARTADGFDSVLCDLWLGVEDGLPMYKKMKHLELPGVRYQYWIEETMRLYMQL